MAATKRATKKAVKPFELIWVPDPSLSDRAKAVRLALALMHEAKVQTWEQLHDLLVADGPEAQILRRAVMRTQHGLLGLLDEYEETLRGLRRAKGNRATFTTVIIECPICLRWGYAPGSVQPPRSCQWTLRCGGNPIRHSAADYTAKALTA